MKTEKIERLKKSGWTTGDARDFLELTPEEEALVETGLMLSQMVRETRQKLGWTQTELAEKLGTKQPNVARLETAAGTSFEKQFQALYRMGVTPHQIGEALTQIAFKRQEKELAVV